MTSLAPLLALSALGGAQGDCEPLPLRGAVPLVARQRLATSLPHALPLPVPDLLPPNMGTGARRHGVTRCAKRRDRDRSAARVCQKGQMASTHARP